MKIHSSVRLIMKFDSVYEGIQVGSTLIAILVPAHPPNFISRSYVIVRGILVYGNCGLMNVHLKNIILICGGGFYFSDNRFDIPNINYIYA